MHSRKHLNNISKVRFIIKKWIAKTIQVISDPEKQPDIQISHQATVLERLLSAKRLRLIVAVSVALVASFFIHPNVAAIVMPVSITVYASIFISVWRKSNSVINAQNKSRED